MSDWRSSYRNYYRQAQLRALAAPRPAPPPESGERVLLRALLRALEEAYFKIPGQELAARRRALLCMAAVNRRLRLSRFSRLGMFRAARSLREQLRRAA